MKNRFVKVIGIAAGVLVLGAAVAKANVASATTAAGPKVVICHFSGHVGDVALSNTGVGACKPGFGGTTIEVALPACINGHGISEARCLRPGNPDEETKEDPPGEPKSGPGGN